MTADALCLNCTGWLAWYDGRGWAHLDGGGAIWQRCRTCGWSGSFPVPTKICPDCGGKGQLRDDHIATPDRMGATA